MTLVALLFAHQAAAGSSEPRGAIEVAGLTVLERQAALAAELGAQRLLVIAERMPPGLAAALTRLSHVEVVRDPAALAAALADGDRILVLDEGLIADPIATRAFVEAPGARLAVKAGDAPYGCAERLDSARFWAGVAVYDGRLVRTVAAGLGEWDLKSTLLRAAVGEGIVQVDLSRDAGAGSQLIEDAAAAEAVGSRLVDAAAPARTGWPARYLYPWPARRLVESLLARNAGGRTLAIAGVGAGLLAVLAFAAGWPAVGLPLALVAPFVADAGVWLGRVRLEPPPRWVDAAFDHAIEPAWYLALAYGIGDRIAPSTAFALALALIAFRVAGLRQATILARAGGAPSPDERLSLYAAGRETLAWALLPFALAGAWGIGLGALAVYAALSFFAWQQRTLVRSDNGAGVKL